MPLLYGTIITHKKSYEEIYLATPFFPIGSCVTSTR